jgi:hypothetical protein
VPRAVADEKARRDKEASKTATQRYWRIDEVDRLFNSYKENFSLEIGGCHINGEYCPVLVNEKTRFEGNQRLGLCRS